jgi:hypothetical protein
MELAEEDATTELYETTSSTNTFTSNEETVTLGVSTYTFPEFLTELNTQYPLQAGSNDSPKYGAPGYHLQLNFTGGKLIFQRQYFQLDDVDFGDWTVGDGTPTLVGQDFDAAGSADDVAVLSDQSIPNASARFEGEITTVGDFRVADQSAGVDIYYMGINLAGYWFYADGAGGETTVASANINDTFSMERLGTIVTYKVNGVTIGTSSVSAANQVAINRELVYHQWLITADAGSLAAFTDSKYTTYFGASDPTSESIIFESYRLARQLGFKHAGVAYEDAGAPAEVESLTEPVGAATEGGVLVCLDPFILESYDADTRVSGRGRNNIIYAITKRDSDTEVSVDTNYPIALDIKNASDTIITNINVSFRNTSNGNLLAFQNNPVLVLLFYGPDER